MARRNGHVIPHVLDRFLCPQCGPLTTVQSTMDVLFTLDPVYGHFNEDALGCRVAEKIADPRCPTCYQAVRFAEIPCHPHAWVDYIDRRGDIDQAVRYCGLCSFQEKRIPLGKHADVLLAQAYLDNPGVD